MRIIPKIDYKIVFELYKVKNRNSDNKDYLPEEEYQLTYNFRQKYGMLGATFKQIEYWLIKVDKYELKRIYNDLINLEKI